MSPRVLPYGTWPSPIAASEVATGQTAMSWPLLTQDFVWWCENRTTEGGRVALMRQRLGTGERGEVTPPGFNLRTGVHEYGGRAYAVHGHLAVGTSFADQRLWLFPPGQPPAALTPESDRRLRYAEPVFDVRRSRIVAVREDHRGGGEAAAAIVAVGLDASDDEGLVLADGHDFCAAPALSQDGRFLAWIGWDHPDMPWDATTLWVAELENAGRPCRPVRVAGGPGESVLQPMFLRDDTLVFASDRTGWWNLYAWDGHETRALCPMEADFAGPLWQLGARWFDRLDERTLVVTVTERAASRLALLDIPSGRLTPIELPFVEVGAPSCTKGRLLAQGTPADAPGALVLVDPWKPKPDVVRSSAGQTLGREWIAMARAISFPSASGRIAHAFHYPPANPDCTAPAGTAPPLIVRSHGGPTAHSGPGFALALQFWTSRGFAVVDVNYTGSSGYGRAYRTALEGHWGVSDVEDCVAAARFLVAEGKADPERLAIRGGSAAGYTTLCALTFHHLFKAGASYYGIGDLELLMRDTHKFESRYLDRLIGPWPEAAQAYHDRSPIHFTDRLSCPVIFFQGLDDKAVPPNQAETMVAALREKGLPVAYLAFAGEGHGFRKAETLTAALEAEHAFFCRVFGLAPEGGVAPLEIKGLGEAGGSR